VNACLTRHLTSVLSSKRFWFFAARNGNAKAPVALWFNGGVGLSFFLRNTPISDAFSTAWKLEHDWTVPRTWSLPNH